MKISIKRAYEPAEKSDGKRILIDRLWPRGLTKEKVAANLWIKNVAPSTELRKWFGHDPDKWVEFQERYKAELMRNPAFSELKAAISGGKTTLVYAAKDEEHNDAVVLKDILTQEK